VPKVKELRVFVCFIMDGFSYVQVITPLIEPYDGIIIA